MIRTAPQPGTGQVEVTFTVPRTAQTDTVPRTAQTDTVPRTAQTDTVPRTAPSVVGDFNDWDPAADPFVLSPDARNWQATVILAPGRRYAFRYLAGDGRWFTDEDAGRYEDTGSGERSAILDLSPTASLPPPGEPADPLPQVQPGGFNGGGQSQSPCTGGDEPDRLRYPGTRRTGRTGPADSGATRT